jgi:hypothetical protein
VTHRGGTLGLVVAIAICSTAATAAGETETQSARTSNPDHRIPVLRIVQSKHTAQSQTKAPTVKKRLVRQKVAKHRIAFAHKLTRPAPPDAAKSTDNPPFAVEQVGKLTFDNPSKVSLASDNGTDRPEVTGNERLEAKTTDTQLHGIVIKTQQVYVATAVDHDAALNNGNSIFPILAPLSGAILASGLGLFLVRSGRRSPGLGLNALTTA